MRARFYAAAFRLSELGVAAKAKRMSRLQAIHRQRRVVRRIVICNWPGSGSLGRWSDISRLEFVDLLASGDPEQLART
eukprot:3770867-Pyramimonas_sp.AAC.1